MSATLQLSWRAYVIAVEFHYAREHGSSGKAVLVVDTGIAEPQELRVPLYRAEELHAVLQAYDQNSQLTVTFPGAIRGQG